MRSIEELTAQELHLIALVESVGGTMEEKYSSIENLSIFEEYKVIHNEYADLCETSLEALKRAVFLYWYLCVEPPCYTGLKDLYPEAISKTISTLNTCLLNDAGDAEQKWMLSYYFVWDFVFEKFQHLETIAELLSNKESNLPASINRMSMEQRGQMGKYWNSLNVFK